MSNSPRRRPRTGLTPAVEEERTVRRAATAASVGNVAEWYDFGLFSYLAAIVLNRVLFPDAGEWSGVLTLGTFAAAFLVRPLGGFVFGPLGDRIGRTRVLSFTVLLMTVATVALGLVPSYDTIGIAAPLLVLLIRMLQGFSAGGEYTGALTLVAEYAPDRRRGFFGSWLEFGTITGYALGAGVCGTVVAVLPEDDLLAWGWRIPFMLALPLGIAGIYLRMRLEDTPAFRQLMERSPALAAMPYRRAMQILATRYRGPALVAGGLVVAWNVTNYVLTNYMPTYLTSTLPRHGEDGASGALAGALQVVVMLFALCVIIPVGRLSDRVGRKPILMTGALALIVLGLPAVWLMRGGPLGQAVGLLLLGAVLVCFAAVAPATLPAQFPTMVRYGGLGVVFNLFVSFFAGTAPTVIETAVTATGNLDWPGYYLVGAGVVGVISTLFLKETAGRPLPGAAPLTSSADLPPPPLSPDGIPMEQPRDHGSH
ncbi:MULTISPECIES: MFS transporter [Pseudonocardia]|uniref:MFS transporter n=2 Tax=Pseudonocardia TaxID=1847 RepID=A0ABQ0S1D8_9PSEU|nr:MULTISPECIES: MFS transporter [Pseudonocardia]OSY38966.1 Proline/betaine transporter [Pseudonocardia autotrophica]TDN76222.1 MHS family proline/betaine transporter-like MFS transporter [Pseudonocardia autotrophica]BBG00204.1 MFS transporter [Pseudonocardia autotrophica]GEC26727.1 MFS transporter [Pseudonocardia saturnea]